MVDIDIFEKDTTRVIYNSILESIKSEIIDSDENITIELRESTNREYEDSIGTYRKWHVCKNEIPIYILESYFISDFSKIHIFTNPFNLITN